MKKTIFIAFIAIALISCGGNDPDPPPPPETVATPTASLAQGTYTGTQTVTLSCTTTGADIYYTLNGTDPTASSTKYATAITIIDNTTLKAIAVKSGMNNSAILTAVYTIQAPQPHTDTITAYSKTINVSGDGTISTTNFNNAMTKLESAIELYEEYCPTETPWGINFIAMVNRHGFEIIIETGNAGPAANASKSMTIGVNYLLSSEVDKIVDDIYDLIDANAFAKAIPSKSKMYFIVFA